MSALDPAATPPAVAATPARDLDAAGVRAALEGGVPQRVGAGVVLGDAGFADDDSPIDALVAVPVTGGGLRRGRVARRGPGPGRQGPGAQHDGAPGPPGRTPAGDVGPHAGHHLGRAGLRGARRLVVRTGGRARLPVRQRRRLRRQAGVPGGRGRPTAGRRSTAGRSGSCGRARTSYAGDRSDRPWPAGSPRTGPACSGSGSVATRPPGRPGTPWWPTWPRWRRGWSSSRCRSPGPPRRSPCAPRCGRRPPCSPPSSTTPAPVPVLDVPVEVTSPGGARATARCRGDGSIGIVVSAGRRPRSGRPALLRHRRRPPGPRMGGFGGHRRRRRRHRAGPDHAVLRHPAGPGHARRSRCGSTGRPTGDPGQRLRRRVRGRGRGPLAGGRPAVPTWPTGRGTESRRR